MSFAAPEDVSKSTVLRLRSTLTVFTDTLPAASRMKEPTICLVTFFSSPAPLLTVACSQFSPEKDEELEIDFS
ncbi:hypothetical protein D3C87_1221520 [compost metagenome]